MNPKENEQVRIGSIILAGIVIIMILLVLGNYAQLQRKSVIQNAEQVTNQMAENIASTIAGEIGYAKSSIKLTAVSIAQSMTSENIENPSETIRPMVDNTPFGGIEYIRADGMNVMNIGEPFDASDRVYYIEGIKGNTGVWNNMHPKTSRETLMNFYTPLVYEGKNVGVITGYIAATSQIAPLFEKTLYGQDIYGFLVDEKDMVLCSSMETEYVPDLSLDMFMDRFGTSQEQKEIIHNTIGNATEIATFYKDPSGQGRICVAVVPGTSWKVAIIIPASSFERYVSENTRNSVNTLFIISVIVVSYAAFILLRNVKRRKKLAAEKAKLQVENLEIRDIIASANMGTWHIELVEGEESRMYVDDTMKRLLGIEDVDHSPEQVYTDWFSRVSPEAVQSVLDSVERMVQGNFDENTYLWEHPKKGLRYVRCGGTAQKIPGGVVLRGYHYDVDDVVREDQAKVEMLRRTLNEKNEYYSVLGTLGDVFYSMHVIDIVNDTVLEYNAKNQVKEIVNHRQGAADMMIQVMSATTSDEYKEAALEFTDLKTLADRMVNKKIISKQLIGKNTGWFLASFITLDKDENGKPTRVICTTRVIDEEKRQEETLIRKTQTDELTGLLNRRAYEDNIYAHNDTPEEEGFTYISLDVNGLKVVNDNQGHMAGDEMIIGACQCMKRTLGLNGNLYRIGGDEFVAIVFCNDKELQKMLADFDEEIANWSGKLVDKLSISYGYVSKEEMPGLSVRQLGAAAEQRMYAAKEAHYRKAGLDRRGQKDAHKALCDLYTKILKINITHDTYQIVNMDNNEQTEEKGFADSISKWLRAFGESGQVHPEDLEEYLKQTNLQYMREYFAGDKTSLHIFYRRKFENGFKQVMMELIPAGDYSDDNMSLFLYVKNIER